jgi:NAD(P)-dependent dehydrogenase (short-subunit alcohol dehydrogenase family)
VIRSFAGKVAVVTGGAGGIGRALVERFTDEGMKAVIADIDAQLIDQAVAELREQGREVIGVRTDVTEQSDLESLRDQTLETYGSVDVLCNNAAVGSASEGHCWEHHMNDWRWTFDVNVLGVIQGCNVFLPTMLAQDTEGAVVNTTSSNGGFIPLVHSAVYATSKAAVTTFTECLWGQLREMDAKITAHLLFPSTKTPGLLKTGIWQPGRHRHARYDRPGAPPADTGRDGLTTMLEQAKAAGREVPFAPLSEVADLCVDGIRDDVFWIAQPGSGQQALARAETQANRTAPIYLTQAPNVMTGRAPGSND